MATRSRFSSSVIPMGSAPAIIQRCNDAFCKCMIARPDPTNFSSWKQKNTEPQSFRV